MKFRGCSFFVLISYLLSPALCLIWILCKKRFRVAGLWS